MIRHHSIRGVDHVNMVWETFESVTTRTAHPWRSLDQPDQAVMTWRARLPFVRQGNVSQNLESVRLELN